MTKKIVDAAIQGAKTRIKDMTHRMVADSPLRHSTIQCTNGVAEHGPLDLMPSPNNSPASIVETLAEREKRARQMEALCGHPTLVMTKEEVATLKIKLDTAPLDGKQKMLRSLAHGLSSDAVRRLALELATRGRLADGYGLALLAYSTRRADQDALADRIVSGLDMMHAAAEGGWPVANTGSNWRRSFAKRIGDTLLYLGERNISALRTIVAALYTQSMAVKGKNGVKLDSDELDRAIKAPLGEAVGCNESYTPLYVTTDEAAAQVMRMLVDTPFSKIERITADDTSRRTGGRSRKDRHSRRND